MHIYIYTTAMNAVNYKINLHNNYINYIICIYIYYIYMTYIINTYTYFALIVELLM